MKFNYVVVFGGVTILVLPFLLSSLGASSWTLGTLIGAVMTLAIVMTKGRNHLISMSKLALIFVVLVFNILGTSVYYQNFPVQVQIGGALIVGILLIFSETLGKSLARFSEDKLRKFLTWITFILLASSAIEIAIDAKFLSLPKAILYFREPSHFAVAIPPFIFYTILTSRGFTSIGISMLLLLESIVLENFTLLIVFLLTVLILLVRVSLSLYAKACLVLLLSLIISTTLLSEAYFFERFTLDRTNLSSLVYLRGLEAASSSLSRPPFIGFGFQMMGSRAPITLAVEQLDEFDVEYLNANDGGFVAAKFVAEFGWIGFFVLIYLIACLIPALFSSLLLTSKGLATKNDFIFISCSLSVFIMLFVRGSGYLGPFLILTYLSFGFMPSVGFFRSNQPIS